MDAAQDGVKMAHGGARAATATRTDEIVDSQFSTGSPPADRLRTLTAWPGPALAGHNRSGECINSSGIKRVQISEASIEGFINKFSVKAVNNA